jgi:hypothetical protein
LSAHQLSPPRDDFEIEQVFKTASDARKAKFRHYFTYQGTPIYTRRISKNKRLFAIVSD